MSVSENQQGTASVHEKMASSPSVAKPEGRPHPCPTGSSSPTSRVRNRANPEGILQQSPGLRPRSFWAGVSIRRWPIVSIWVGLMVKGCPKERGSYPGSTESRRTNPNGVVCVGGERGHNPVGVETRFARYPRVARRLATLGWRTQSLWDCLRRHAGLVLTRRAENLAFLWDCLEWHPGLVG